MQVLYFAWVRQKVGLAQEQLAPPPGTGDVAGLVGWLRGRSAGHAEAFADLRQIRVAVNQEFVGFDHPLAEAQEVAFFPPVTGG